MNELSNTFTASFDKCKNSPAIIYKNNIYNYNQLPQIFTSALQNFKSLGLKSGDKLLFVSRNRVEEIFAILSALYAGIIAVPISFRYDRTMLDKIKSELNCEILDDLSELVDISDKSQANDINPMNLPSIDPDKDATILFTSGSMSLPKGVVHSFTNHYYSASGSNDNIPLTSEDKWLLSLPLFHIGGMAIIFRTILAGAAMVIPGEDESLEDAVVNYRITHLSLVAAQFQRLLNSKADFSTLKAILLGGSYIPQPLIKNAFNMNLPIFTSYGMTEAASQISATPPGADYDTLTGSGRLLKHRQLSFGANDEILIKGQTLFERYLHDDNPLDTDGWFHTGDIGFIDSDDNLRITGRVDNMFISGGENIHPEQIEKIIKENNDIEEIIVVPLKDATFGHIPVAFLKCDNKLEEPLAYHGLEKFKIPKIIFDWPTDLENNSLKLNRDKLKKLAQNLADRSK